MTKATNQYEVAWQRQVQSVRRFIKKLDKTPTMHGQKWKDSMLRHYRKRLKELLKERPKPR